MSSCSSRWLNASQGQITVISVPSPSMPGMSSPNPFTPFLGGLLLNWRVCLCLNLGGPLCRVVGPWFEAGGTRVVLSLILMALGWLVELLQAPYTVREKKILASGWSKHFDLRGSRLSWRTALQSLPHQLWLSVSLSSHSHENFLVPEPSFQVHPGSKNLFALWLFSVPDHSFPRKLFSMEPQKKGGPVLGSF